MGRNMVGSEVADRWLRLFPKSWGFDDKKAAPSEIDIKNLAGHADRIAEIRSRLSSVSWFMRSLNEHIARKANREDGCKGRFWEGRFVCQALLDESAVLACMAYVDLNPVRAGLADRPENSDFTSVQERIRARGGALAQPVWLSAIGGENPAGQPGMLSMTLDEYLSLIDLTGRLIRSDKPGAIPDDLAPLLDRLKINQVRWVGTAGSYGRIFHLVAGRAQSIAEAARRRGKIWLAGLTAGRLAFTSN